MPGTALATIPQGKSMDQLLASIAKQHLFMDTLDTRKSDGLDFHDLSVWCIRAALEAAFIAGQQSVPRR